MNSIIYQKNSQRKSLLTVSSSHDPLPFVQELMASCRDPLEHHHRSNCSFHGLQKAAQKQLYQLPTTKPYHRIWQRLKEIKLLGLKCSCTQYSARKCNGASKNRPLGQRLLRNLLLSMALFSSMNASHAGDSFTSEKVLASSIVPSLECLDYCFIGVCLYVKCTPLGCSIKSTPWVEHRMPDLVVSAYNQPGETTWLEARALYGLTSATLLQEVLGALTGLDIVGGGQSTNINKSIRERDQGTKQKADMLRFKEVSVVGNPFANELRGIFPEYLCKSEVKPLKGYFQSEVDGFVWRYQLPEFLYRATWIPRMRHIGDRSIWNEWGGIHPRHGFLYSKDDMETAAVASARAVDIVTRPEQPHLYLPVEEIYESDEVIDKWSMIYPNFEPGKCDVFGGINYSIDRQSYFGGYGWMYWGRHECCVNADGPVIQKIKTTPVCLK